MNTLLAIIIGFLFALVIVFALSFFFRKRGTKKNAREINVQSSIQDMKAIGELSVFKVITKEIVTESDHLLGNFGKKYMRWLLSNRKIAMIFEFSIDFRYNLRSEDFRIVSESEHYVFYMPPCMNEIGIRNVMFYDEQRSKLLPGLLPDIINEIFDAGFSEEDKNRFVNAAKNEAEEQAKKMIRDIGSEVRQSAMQTLKSLARAFDIANIRFVFSEEAAKTKVTEAKNQ
ncbi:MAG: DUF4230 domain-containing protein [Candidatus Marinimicrobia bacterium]|jgi:hypothetical protein|nr:DUF4230 domain-containing protein [Candidatus Neomarinimicrobiota bacterium]MDX9777869.1 DUF4230 domain-containing protein [bacterium]